MRNLKLIIGSIAAALMALPCRADTISAANLQKDGSALKADGVHLKLTGPDALPVVLGDLEVLGATAPFLNNSVTSRYYSGSATLDQPATKVTINVQRLNNSGWDNPITLTAYDKGKRVGSTSLNIAPLGENTQLSITAPAIDKFTWGGDGWVYHPYEVKGFTLDVSAAKSVSSTPPGSVSAADDVSAVPEPASCALIAAIGAVMLTSRRKLRSDRNSRLPQP